MTCMLLRVSGCGAASWRLEATSLSLQASPRPTSARILAFLCSLVMAEVVDEGKDSNKEGEGEAAPVDAHGLVHPLGEQPGLHHIQDPAVRGLCRGEDPLLIDFVLVGRIPL